MRKTRILILTLLVCGVMLASDARADETALFTATNQPDALILLDLSGSMAWNPAGDDLKYGSTDSCYADTANCSGTGCSGGFCGSSKSAVTFYAAAACATPDTTNCVGTNCSNGFCSSAKGASTVYAASSCSTPSIANCRGTACGRTDGFCNSAVSSGTTYYAHSSCSTPDTDNCRYSENWSDCRDGFCASSHQFPVEIMHGGVHDDGLHRRRARRPPVPSSAHPAAARKIAAASPSPRGPSSTSSTTTTTDTINSTDETSLGVRLGYMRFTNCCADDTGNSYTSGCNSLIKAIGSTYSSINTSVQAESASGGTPLISALREAKLYLDDHKAADAAKDCRQKFVILITDGSDTYGCGSDGSECDNDRYKNRREAVAKAKALGDAGYKVFVIGFGTAMPPYLRNTLNWMAYYGGTDNPNSPNSGSTTAYSIVTGCNATTNPSACCTRDEPDRLLSDGRDELRQQTVRPLTATCYDATKPYPGTTGNSTTNYRASTNDPGYLDLSGYAYIAADADELVAAVKAAINIIREATYSFSQSSIQSSRTVDENFIYEGSFQPITGDPFWRGHLRRFSINSTNGAVASVCRLGCRCSAEQRTAASRNIKTYKGGVLQDFTTANITPANLGITDATLTETQKNAQRDAVVGYIRGESAYNPDNWKLGDVFRSTPITVGAPSAYFDDIRDTSSPSAFSQHRAAHPRNTSSNNRVIVVGANDGQLHAIKTSDGSEVWSFIPPNLLPRLKLISHATEPTSLTHVYYVDGPITVADAWLPSSWSNGRSKNMSEWRTLLVSGEGRGAATNLWSSSASCDSGFNPTYTSAFPYYCGYYALDVTDSLAPVFKWRLGITSAQAYMGAPWSKMTVGRVLDGGLEKWVGFIGGGASAPGAAESGKGIFVIDLASGNVLWSRTKADDANLNDPMPGPPAIVDTDNDGFIDAAYLGSLGGHMWRFTFCLKKDGDSCGTSSWSGGRLFQASGGGRIYTSATAVKDGDNNVWVYWGTGDKLDPTNATTSDKLYAVKDDRTTTRTIGSLQDVTGSSGLTDPSLPGYYINLSAGEKMLANPTVFGGVFYATSFTPSGLSGPCYQGGTAKLYGLNYLTGGGALVIPGSEDRPSSIDIGTGIPSAPVISLRPDTGTPDLYVTTSGSGTTGAQTSRANTDPPGLPIRTNLLFWKDRRVE